MLYKHQIDAVKRFTDKKEMALLFDTGTGKSRTVLAIAAEKYRKGEIDSVLIIAPNGVHLQWCNDEIPRWLGTDGMSIQYEVGVKPYTPSPDRLSFLCVNIEKFSGSQSTYQKYVDWAGCHTFLVLDEATKIKNPKSLRSQRLLTAFNDVVKRGRTIVSSTPRTACRAILTGTLITNSPFDAWAPFNFLRPGYFKLNFYAFKSYYGVFYTLQLSNRPVSVPINESVWNAILKCPDYQTAHNVFGVSLTDYSYMKEHPTYTGPYRHLDELRASLSPLASVVKITDVLDMPAKNYIKKKLVMTKEQTKAYNEVLADYYTQLEELSVELSVESKVELYIRLQQIASGFLSTPTEDPESRKITWISDVKINQLLTDVEATSGQVIVVCHFSAEAERIYDVLSRADVGEVALQTGFKKVGSIEDFRDGKYRILIANVKVISMGFNLQNCHYMIFYSNTFSLEDRLQTEARIWRAGQTEKCFYIDYIITDNSDTRTVDEKVYDVLASKKSLSDYFREGGR